MGNRGPRRRDLLRMAGGGLVGAATLGGSARGAVAQPAPPYLAPAPHPAPAQLWQEYLAAPDTHPQVPNVSYAGYRRGERDIPRLPERVNAKTFGATGDGNTDDTVAINAAIDATAAAGGGAVVLPPGTYKTSGLIRMHHSGVVLRGLGTSRTVIFCDKSLEEGYAFNRREGDLSQWSWSGGLVWFVPKRLLESMRDAEFLGNEGWMDNETLTPVVADASRGARTLAVEDAGDIRAGDHVLLAVRNVPDSSLLAHLAGDVDGTAAYDWNSRATRLRPEISTWAGAPNFVDYRWPVEVTHVSGDQVTLAQPLKFDLRTVWEPRLQTLGPVVRESGIEDLTLRMRLTQQQPHNRDFGFNGPAFSAALNCWARNVHVENADNGFGLHSCKGVTLRDVSVGGRQRHHSYICRVQAHDNLVTRFRIDRATVPLPSGSTHHGINVEGLASGNVWSDGVMENGTFDSHRALPFENVRTDITVTNDAFVGGAGDAGPRFGARFAHWNVRVTNGRTYAVAIHDMAPRAAVVGIAGATTFASGLPRDFTGDLGSVSEALGSGAVPADLHAAQLRARL
ncbi:glycosyl hydrolase family 28-related protein [Actinopolymorpha sp. B17G11]|uniref:glycosyl hydrolase family 28-related protein n=1 Tax=Actinopolymorpha sp. B17G11 TaxID=3160861 RepID=UPI0032E52163